VVAFGAAVFCLAGTQLSAASTSPQQRVSAATHAPAGAAAGAAQRDWFWSKWDVRLALLWKNLYWRQIGEHHLIAGFPSCTGLGHWIVHRHVRMFRNFFCHVKIDLVDKKGKLLLPLTIERYNLIIHVKGRFAFRYTYGGDGKGAWGWTPRYTADALVNSDVHWTGGVDDILESTCSAFGQSFLSGGSRYWKHFYCSVKPAQGRPYAIVTQVVGQYNAVDRFVSFLDELPFTQSGALPTPSSNTSNQQYVNWLLQNQIVVAMMQNGYKAQNRARYGSNYAPTGPDFISGQVGCATDVFAQTPFSSYGSCG
jgi:hypothetical protein